MAVQVTNGSLPDKVLPASSPIGHAAATPIKHIIVCCRRTTLFPQFTLCANYFCGMLSETYPNLLVLY